MPASSSASIARAGKLEAEARKVDAEAGGNGEQAEEIRKLRAEYEAKIAELMRQKMLAEIDRKIAEQKITMEAEDKVYEAQHTVDIDREKIASDERIAKNNKIADDKVAELQRAMQDLSADIDDRLDQILEKFKADKEIEGAKREADDAKKDAKRETEKAKDDAKRTVEAEKLKSSVEKKVGGLDKKLAVTAAKASAAKKPAPKK